MKLRKLTIFAFIILGVLPIRAYEYFTIYFKDGTKSEAFYAVDIDSMRYSKISVDSIEYNEWKVQEIYARSNIYRYALEGIEKIEFKDVDETAVANNIANVSSFVAPYFATCESTDELSQYLPEILSTEGVEKAWVDNLTLFIKIVDFGIIQFSYNPKRPAKSSTDISLANSRTRSLEYKATSNPNQNAQVYFPDEKPKNMCIINQVYQDYDFKDDTYTKEILQNTYKNFGIQTDIINEPSPDFFYKDIFDYDLVFIDTHGNYDGARHWLMSGDKLWESLFTKKDDRDSLIKKWKPGVIATAIIKFMRLYHNYHVTPNILSISYIVERHNENSDRYNLVAYTNVSEDFIHMSPYKFKNGSIIFCAACEGMKGNGRKNSDYSLANIFVQRGASCFFGYNNINFVGGKAGNLFFNYLINGKSIGGSLREMWKIAPCYLEEIRVKTKNNIEVEKNYSSLIFFPLEDSITHIRFVYPQTKEAQVKTDNDSLSVILTGNIIFGRNTKEKTNVFDYVIDNKYNYDIDIDVDFQKNNNFDFLISDNPQMTNPDSINITNNEDEYDFTYTSKWEGVLKEFKQQPLESGKTYYYCARLNDGYDNCYGEVKEFTIPEKNDNVIQTLPVEKGEITPLPEREFFNLCKYHLRFNGKIYSPSFIADYKSTTGFTLDKYELGFLISDNPNMENAENVYVYGKRGSHRYYQDLSYNEEDNSVSFAYDHNCSITENKKMYCQAYLYLIDKSGQYTEKLFGELVEYENGIRICPDDNHPHMIDLGLPSGTKWACCNVGSSAPWEDGGLYAWGESVEKEEYTQNNYSLAGLKYAENNTGVAMSFPLFDLQDSDYRKYDTASVLWGETWQMPNNDQAEELFREIDIHNPVYYYNDNYNQGGAAYNRRGEVFKGPNGNYILIPRGDHWTSTGSDQTSGTVRARNVAKTFHWSRDETYYRNADEIYFGHHVRPVAK